MSQLEDTREQPPPPPPDSWRKLKILVPSLIRNYIVWCGCRQSRSGADNDGK